MPFGLLTRYSETPYSVLGLWRNPFGELTPEERAELAVVETDQELGFLRLHEEDAIERKIIQYVGGCGFGKTTHLLALRFEIQNLIDAEIPYLYFPEESWVLRKWMQFTGQRQLVDERPNLPKERPIILDEMQRAGWWNWRKLLHSTGPLLIGTHVDKSERWRRAGFDVLTINVEERAHDCLHLQRALNQRIESSRSTTENPTADSKHAHCPTLSINVVEQLAMRHQFNLRAIEYELYDQIQNCIREQTPWQPAT